MKHQYASETITISYPILSTITKEKVIQYITKEYIIKSERSINSSNTKLKKSTYNEYR